MQRQELQSDNHQHFTDNIHNNNQFDQNSSFNSSICILPSSSSAIVTADSNAVANIQSTKISSPNKTVQNIVANENKNSITAPQLVRATVATLPSVTQAPLSSSPTSSNTINKTDSSSSAQAFSHFYHNTNQSSVSPSFINKETLNLNNNSYTTNTNINLINNNTVHNKKHNYLSDQQSNQQQLLKNRDEHHTVDSYFEECNNNSRSSSGSQPVTSTTPNSYRRHPVSRGIEFIPHQVRGDTTRETNSRGKTGHTKHYSSNQRMK